VRLQRKGGRKDNSFKGEGENISGRDRREAKSARRDLGESRLRRELKHRTFLKGRQLIKREGITKKPKSRTYR